MKNILVFPCGSEIGLEIHRSLKYSTHFRLIGASSVHDHGKFVYDNYIDSVPFHDAPNFVTTMKTLIKDFGIDAIYPTMDAVAATLKKVENLLGCRVIGSSSETTSICASKRETYKVLENSIPIPNWYESLDLILNYPIFIKPNLGYGSRNTHLAHDRSSAEEFINTHGRDKNSFIFCELLPGAEYTIDCFSNRHGVLLFTGARKRNRISNGISVNTHAVSEYQDEFKVFAETINAKLKPRGAWFFQMKEDVSGKPNLLEVAARLGGSSSLFRSKGVNFALLSAFDSFDIDVSIETNNYVSELDRALSNKYKIDIEYSSIYVDYDDCILIHEKVNPELLSFLYKSLNQNKRIILITRHAGNLDESLKKHRISQLFDEIIHLQKNESKSAYINPEKAIFIDDSYAERLDVKRTYGIPVFSLDMIEALI